MPLLIMLKPALKSWLRGASPDTATLRPRLRARALCQLTAASSRPSAPKSVRVPAPVASMAVLLIL